MTLDGSIDFGGFTNIDGFGFVVTAVDKDRTAQRGFPTFVAVEERQDDKIGCRVGRQRKTVDSGKVLLSKRRSYATMRETCDRSDDS